MKPDRLPRPWVDKIFTTMTAIYGARFADLWRDIDPDIVKDEWASALASFGDQPECFALSLRQLREAYTFPPVLPEFVKICRSNYKAPSPLMLDHKLSDEEIARNRARIKAMAEMIANNGTRDATR